MNAYVYKNGVLVDFQLGGGDVSGEAFDDIEAIGFAPFDYNKEIEVLKEQGITEEWFTLDACEMEIMINTNQGKFMLKGWGLDADFKNYEKHSINIQKLVKVIKRLQLYYGESVISIL